MTSVLFYHPPSLRGYHIEENKMEVFNLFYALLTQKLGT